MYFMYEFDVHPRFWRRPVTPPLVGNGLVSNAKLFGSRIEANIGGSCHGNRSGASFRVADGSTGSAVTIHLPSVLPSRIRVPINLLTHVHPAASRIVVVAILGFFLDNLLPTRCLGGGRLTLL